MVHLHKSSWCVPTSVRHLCRNCVHWRIKIQRMMMRHQQKLWAKQVCHGARRLPYKPTEDEIMAHSVSHLSFRAWCSHCVQGFTRDWPHHDDYGPPPDRPMVAMDFYFVNTGADDGVLTILAMKEKPFQSAGATVLPDKSASEFAVAKIIEYLDFW